MKTFITQAWRGEKPLWLVFWVFNIAFSIVILVLIFTLLSFLPSAMAGVLVFVLGLFALVYLVWIYVSIWRCAKNSRYFCTLARIYVILHIIGTSGRLAAVAIGTYELYSGSAAENVIQ